MNLNTILRSWKSNQGERPHLFFISNSEMIDYLKSTINGIFLNACNEICNEPIIDNYGGLLTDNS